MVEIIMKADKPVVPISIEEYRKFVDLQMKMSSIEKVLRKSYNNAKDEYKHIADVYCVDIADILEIDLSSKPFDIDLPLK